MTSRGHCQAFSHHHSNPTCPDSDFDDAGARFPLQFRTKNCLLQFQIGLFRPPPNSEGLDKNNLTTIFLIVLVEGNLEGLLQAVPSARCSCWRGEELSRWKEPKMVEQMSLSLSLCSQNRIIFWREGDLIAYVRPWQWASWDSSVWESCYCLPTKVCRFQKSAAPCARRFAWTYVQTTDTRTAMSGNRTGRSQVFLRAFDPSQLYNLDDSSNITKKITSEVAPQRRQNSTTESTREKVEKERTQRKFDQEILSRCGIQCMILLHEGYTQMADTLL